jgi:hypothetical protein
MLKVTLFRGLLSGMVLFQILLLLKSEAFACQDEVQLCCDIQAICVQLETDRDGRQRKNIRECILFILKQIEQLRSAFIYFEFVFVRREAY